MKLSAKKQIEFNVLYKSLIGKEIEILDSKNKNQIGVKGTLIHESANIISLDIKGSTKRFLKQNIIIKFFLKGKPLKMDARLLIGTITNRIKKLK